MNQRVDRDHTGASHRPLLSLGVASQKQVSQRHRPQLRADPERRKGSLPSITLPWLGSLRSSSPPPGSKAVDFGRPRTWIRTIREFMSAATGRDYAIKKCTPMLARNARQGRNARSWNYRFSEALEDGGFLGHMATEPPNFQR